MLVFTCLMVGYGNDKCIMGPNVILFGMSKTKSELGMSCVNLRSNLLCQPESYSDGVRSRIEEISWYNLNQSSATR